MDGKIAKDKSPVVRDLPAICADEGQAVAFFERARWGEAPACVHCGSVAVYQMRDRRTGARNRRWLWRCKDCGKQFTVRVGTVMEDSLIPFRHWALAWWAANAGKKGVAALEIKRLTGLSYKSALFMMHRIRYAMADGAPSPEDTLSGTVEADETYVGGKPRRRAGDARGKIKRKAKAGRGTSKQAVVGLLMRGQGGKVRAWPVSRVNGDTLQGLILQNVHVSSRILTDEWPGYRDIGRFYAGGHETVDHGAGEYARGDVHVNGLEGFWSILKRGLNGVYHSVSRKHLHRYLSEFSYRYTTRKLEDGARVLLAIKRGDGKRLTYAQQVGKPAA